ncbi:GtrA family protein [Streptomyces sp. H27-D2]|nr:GtrA family protein [Streptomyces sp. H27-D2]MEC4017197.1 GtrA family protein [Streptomyces sp. H27-D2]
MVDTAVFNLCLHTLHLPSVRSGVISMAVATCTNYLGNRYWTYRRRDRSRRLREVGLFLLFSGIGMVIQNGVLALSHYGLDHTSALADNIAKNVVGLGLATLFRFWSYRTWVFRVPIADLGSAGGVLRPVGDGIGPEPGSGVSGEDGGSGEDEDAA